MKNTDSLYLIEYYTTAGDIQFAWVGAITPEDAECVLAMSEKDDQGQSVQYDETIKIDEQSSIVPLALSEGNTARFIRVDGFACAPDTFRA